MRIQFIKLFAIASTTMTLSSCESMGPISNEQLSTGVGAIIGGVIGNQLGGNNKAAWTIVGSGAGALIGNQIGRYLDERDRQRMVQVTEQAITTGETQTWSNPENNTRGEARVIATETKTEPVKVKVLKKKITQVPPLDIMGQSFSSTKKSNLRGGPGTDYEIVGSLAESEVVNVVGKVKNADWYLISHDGVGSGFISASLLKPAPTQTPSSSGIKIAENDVTEEQIITNRVCRKVEQSVSLPDSTTQKETIDACQGPTGWERKV